MTALVIKHDVSVLWKNVEGNYISATLRSFSPTSPPSKQSWWKIQSHKWVNSEWRPSDSDEQRRFRRGNQELWRQRNRKSTGGWSFTFIPQWSSQFELKPLSTWDEMRWNLAAAHMGLEVISSTLVSGSNSCDGKSGEQNRQDSAAQLKCSVQLTL